MVKILYFQSKGTSSIPGWGLRPQVPLGTAKEKKKKEGWKRMGLMDGQKVQERCLGSALSQLMVHMTPQIPSREAGRGQGSNSVGL